MDINKMFHVHITYELMWWVYEQEMNRFCEDEWPVWIPKTGISNLEGRNVMKAYCNRHLQEIIKNDSQYG